ncbi:MAG TPA: M20 family metallopeptidase [Kofleriaceae bacterium]|jgi:amidohydrolase|nr:M20 family metallopeptidase [Kofleriaceae bacterium]
MSLRSAILQAIDGRAETLTQLARRIHENPELRMQEHQAARWLAAEVEGAGVPVERGVGGLSTAFRARIGRAGGPRIAILAEYDALPEIGHACGHNLIGTGAVGAFLGLAAVADQLAGEVVLLGTPGEEGGAGKIKLLDAGAFQGIDAAMMFHPLDRDLLANPALASEWLSFSFTGRPSHAAAAPWDGNSALSAVIQTFNLIDSQRVHFRDGARVHGYITNGGQAVNIIPEHAACQFSVRATRADYLDELTGRVVDCARAAALAAHVDLKVDRARGYKDMRNNMTLARAFGEALASVGRSAPDGDPSTGAGSTDMGDVSHAVPAIHPYIAICERGSAMCHEHAFTAHAASDRGMAGMLDGARAMALAAERFLADADLRAQVRSEFEG